LESAERKLNTDYADLRSHRKKATTKDTKAEEFTTDYIDYTDS
jgi:hypothetical protein